MTSSPKADPRLSPILFLEIQTNRCRETIPTDNPDSESFVVKAHPERNSLVVQSIDGGGVCGRLPSRRDMSDSTRRSRLIGKNAVCKLDTRRK